MQSVRRGNWYRVKNSVLANRFDKLNTIKLIRGDVVWVRYKFFEDGIEIKSAELYKDIMGKSVTVGVDFIKKFLEVVVE